MSKEHTYTNGEVTIIWKPELCIHSKKCWVGLRAVFKPGERPWIKPEGASTERIVSQVAQCPSGALSHRLKDAPDTEQKPLETATTEVEVAAQGPLLFKGSCIVRHADGRVETREQTTAFCRCGASDNKPYCDGTHRKVGFTG